MAVNPNNDPITNYTLQELITLSGAMQPQGFMTECIAADSESHLATFVNPCRIDAFVIGVGTEGEASVTFNLQEYRLKKDSMFIFTPQNILQVQSSTRFRAHAMVVTVDFLRRINIDAKRMMPLFMQFAAAPCIELSAEESRSLRSFIALLATELKGCESNYAREIVSELIAATIYKVGSLLSRYLDKSSEDANITQTRAEEYFRQFLTLLSTHYKQERTVRFYARQLCITPKYLTTLIKRISGQSVSEWIDNYVIIEAKALLKYSELSVQEVAYALNFSNQSFFGSYFKRIVGMSPSQYKAEN